MFGESQTHLCQKNVEGHIFFEQIENKLQIGIDVKFANFNLWF